MNKRRERRYKKRIARKETRAFKIQVSSLSTRCEHLEEYVQEIKRKLDINLSKSPSMPAKDEDVVSYTQGRLPWYICAIKFTWSWIEKILPGKGFAGTDITRIVQAPVPSEIKEYLEDEEIDFGLREKGE